MKSTERHKLKENEFAQTMARTREMYEQRRNEITTVVVAVAAVVILAGGYLWWSNSRESKAQALLASALALAEAPVYTPPPPAPGSPAPVQPPGTFRTDRERLEASVQPLQAAADAYPSSDAGLTARVRLASSLAELGRFSEAEQRYQEVLQKAGSGSIYRQTAKMGLGGKFNDVIKHRINFSETYQQYLAELNKTTPLFYTSKDAQIIEHIL